MIIATKYHPFPWRIPVGLSDSAEYLRAAEPKALSLDDVRSLFFANGEFFEAAAEAGVEQGATTTLEILDAVQEAAKWHSPLLKHAIELGTNLSACQIEEMPPSALQRKALQIVEATRQGQRFQVQQLSQLIGEMVDRYRTAIYGERAA